MRALIFAPLAAAVLLASGCNSFQSVPNPTTRRWISKQDLEQGQTIEIYFDGTANDWQSRTNVRRRFETVAAAEDPMANCFYSNGVGTESLIARATGRGMKRRVMEGYKFLAQHWTEAGNGTPKSKDTRVRIFGFSRGALQARMLAGILAHCGLPLGSREGRGERRLTDQEIDRICEIVWELSRDQLRDASDGSSPEVWSRQLEANRERTIAKVQETFPHVKFVNPDIEFMGLWDTVAGLPSHNLTGEGDRAGNGGARYKVRPYPNTRLIAHALALDEKRSKFQPLLIGSALDKKRTEVFEVWFPGAHADVGGGYKDSNDMAGVSYNWMHNLMVSRKASSRKIAVYEDAAGILHPSDKTFPNNLGSDSQSREIPVGSVIDKTVFTRARHRTDYTPEIKMKDGSVIKIVPTKTDKERVALLDKKLTLFDSTSAPDEQKPLKGPPLPVSEMQIEMTETAVEGPAVESPAPPAAPPASLSPVPAPAPPRKETTAAGAQRPSA